MKKKFAQSGTAVAINAATGTVVKFQRHKDRCYFIVRANAGVRWETARKQHIIGTYVRG